MKKIIGILVSLMLCFTLTSCVTTATAQVDDMYDDVDISVVVTYGTPFYNTEGLILYYVYRDMFYYPYFYRDRYYLHRYHKPLPLERMGRYTPVHKDFYKPNHRINNRINGGIHGNGLDTRYTPRTNERGAIPNNKPNINRGANSRTNTSSSINGRNARPSTSTRNSGNIRTSPTRSSGTPTRSGGTFGGSRRR